MRKYSDQEIITRVQECFHACHSESVFAQKVKEIMNSRIVSEEAGMD